MNRPHWIVLPLLAACDLGDWGDDDGHGHGGKDDTEAASIVFERIGVPTSDSDKRDIIASSTTWVSGVEVSTNYHTIVRSGDSFASGIFGKMFDAFGNPVIAEDGSEFISSDTVDAAVQRVLATIVRDETDHAELAWATLQWALAVGGEPVRDAIAHAFDALGRPRSATTHWTAAQRGHGVAAPDEESARAVACLHEVVLPVARALLASVAPRSAV